MQSNLFVDIKNVPVLNTDECASYSYTFNLAASCSSTKVYLLVAVTTDKELETILFIFAAFGLAR